MTAYLGGVPYDPDVRKLEEAFGVPPIGTLIEYAQISAVLQCSRESHRFRGVLDAWRTRLLREHNVEAKTLRGVGIEMMEGNERVDMGARRSRLNARQLGRITRKVGMVPGTQLDALHLTVRDHLVLLNQRILVEAGQRDKKRAEITGAGAYETLPPRGPRK